MQEESRFGGPKPGPGDLQIGPNFLCVCVCLWTFFFVRPFLSRRETILKAFIEKNSAKKGDRARHCDAELHQFRAKREIG